MNFDNFIDILKSNDEDKIKLFLLENGKKQKPFSPFYFINRNTEKDEVENNDKSQ